MKNFLAHTDEIREEMLREISCASIEDLFKQIPVKFKDFAMGNPLSEMEAQRKVKALARKIKPSIQYLQAEEFITNLYQLVLVILLKDLNF